MQQVNLYTDVLRPKKVVLSLAHIIAITASIFLVLALLTWIKSGSVQRDMVTAERKSAQLQSLQGDTDILRERVKRIVRDEQLVETNEKLKRQLKQREQLAQVLGSSISSGHVGFSEFMIGLGKQKVSSLWLTRIYLADKGNAIALQGVSSDVSGVPLYLANLKKEAIFLGRNFDDFEMKEGDGGHIFTLKSGRMPGFEVRK